QASQDLVASWSSDTLAQARQLGLGARHLEPRGDLASLRKYAWSPFSDESRLTNIKQVTLPSGSPDGLRDRVEVLMIHPLANSGARDTCRCSSPRTCSSKTSRIPRTANSHRRRHCWR